jgi:predicted dinucleotide-binding enzyme
VRNPKPDSLQPAARLEEAASFGDVLLLSVPWDAAEPLLTRLPSLDGKIILDATNPVLPDLSGLSTPPNTSAGEIVQKLAAGAKVVKIFNTVGSSIMANPHLQGRSATMLYCGDDPQANKIAAGLALEIGFEPVHAGPLTQARLLEPFAQLWISLAFGAGLGREFAFLLTHR